MKEYPKWMYGPDEQSRIFHKDDIVPKGWEDHPDKVGKQQPDAPEPRKESVRKTTTNEPTAEERANTIRDIRDAAKAQGIDIELSDDASVEDINAAIDKLTQES